MKKLLALILCLALALIPLSSVAAFADGEGYTLDEESKTYTVTTADGFLAVIGLINAGKFDYNIKLAADIDLDGKTYTPIVPSWNKTTNPNDLYVGTFDGDGHSISNMTITGNNQFQGMISFGGDGVTVKNLTLVNPSITSKDYVGFIIGSSRGTNVTISNVHIKNGSIVSTANYIGGLIGRYDIASGNVQTLVENCTIEASLSGTQSMGGVTGGEGVGGNFTAIFRNIVVTGTFAASNATSRIGGIIGYSNIVDIAFENCVTFVQATGTNDIGGLTGVANKPIYVITNCYSNIPFSGRLSADSAKTFTITNSAVLSDAESADFFSGAPTEANANNITVTLNGETVSCATFKVPTTNIKGVRTAAAAMFNEEGAFQTNALALVQTATAHDHAVDAEKWEKDETNHWHVCTICDEAVDVAAHTFGDWTEVTPASVDAEGLRSHTCTVCGYEENDVIPKIEAASSEESGEEQSSEVPSGEVSSEVGTADGDDLDPDALGCKSVVGASFGLLFVVAGAAIMIGKKKEH